MDEMPIIRFKFAAAKAKAAIYWMVTEQPDIDLHTVLKTCYFADKAHLNDHGRPIFGAVYRAMRFGPVPLEIYEMVKGEVIWLSELACDRYPWQLNGYRLRPMSNDAPDMSPLSNSDFDALRSAFVLSKSMTFDARTAATHGPDWQKADLGIMHYEDMIDEDKIDQIVPYLRETAKYLRL